MTRDGRFSSYLPHTEDRHSIQALRELFLTLTIDYGLPSDIIPFVAIFFN
ncbi:hypothetical protein KQ939_09295 [Planococcus sp. CP5-4]|nr:MULTISPECIES: hypothetical protein [unclassified Planococcus (in: firmicutes)]MBU9674762.1 hypothetical protein [Planococcus sp. CP5-4_YE]MBV0908858.1 hypothetical protein [Planococcus sp. CP5-4_UN]MBW6063907.1 hypothetical protein [Planococcus sp. CP5-4]